MKLIAAAALAAAFSVATPAVAEEQDIKAECQKYAQEDNIAADEMDAYMAQCMEDMAAAQSESAEDEPAEEGSKE